MACPVFEYHTHAWECKEILGPHARLIITNENSETIKGIYSTTEETLHSNVFFVSGCMCVTCFDI